MDIGTGHTPPPKVVMAVLNAAMTLEAEGGILMS